jgi:hypothetical protein
MGKMQIPKKIRVEDFSGENKEVIERIGYAYNSFADEVYSILNGNIDTSNLNRQLADIIVLIDNTGKLKSQPQIKTTISGKIRGINVISAINQVNPNTYPVSAPFVSYAINGQTLTILNVSGLQSNSEYSLVLELIV